MADSRLADLEKAGVRTVRMTYPDLHGISRGKDYPIEYFRHLVEDGGGFCEAIMTVDLRHVVTAGFEHGFQDILGKPDLDTLVPIPWEPGTAWCIADLTRMDGEPYEVDPRGAVRRAVAEYADLGLHPVIGPGARVLPVRARPDRAERLPPLRRQRQPRLHRRPRGRPAPRPVDDARRVRRHGPRRDRREPRVRPQPVRDQHRPRAGPRGRRPGVPPEVGGQGHGRPRGAPGDVHREALERRRGLRLSPARLAVRRRRDDADERCGRPGGDLGGGAPLHRRPPRARPGADGVLQPDDERLPPDPPRGARADAGLVGARQPPDAGARPARARRRHAGRVPGRRRRGQPVPGRRRRRSSPASTGSSASSSRRRRSRA